MWGRQTFGLSSKLFPKFEMFILQKGQGLEKMYRGELKYCLLRLCRLQKVFVES